jgi:two-component system, NtrC family, nitrogen regulation sensor histidine kinase NtrY
MAFELAQSGDASPYLTEAQTLAQEAQLDFLEIVAPMERSSAPRSGRRASAIPSPMQWLFSPHFSNRKTCPTERRHWDLCRARRSPFRLESTHSKFASWAENASTNRFSPICPSPRECRSASTAMPTVTTIGTPASLRPPDPARLIPGRPANSQRGPLSIPHRPGAKNRPAVSAILYLTNRREDSVSATAIPLKRTMANVLAVLTVTISRAGMVEAQQHIRAIAYGVAAGGILLAIVCSLWIAARVSRPIEQLAARLKRWPAATGRRACRNAAGATRSACWRAASTT